MGFTYLLTYLVTKTTSVTEQNHVLEQSAARAQTTELLVQSTPIITEDVFKTFSLV